MWNNIRVSRCLYSVEFCWFDLRDKRKKIVVIIKWLVSVNISVVQKISHDLNSTVTFTVFWLIVIKAGQMFDYWLAEIIYRCSSRAIIVCNKYKLNKILNPIIISTYYRMCCEILT